MARCYDVARLSFQRSSHFWPWALMPPPVFVTAVSFCQCNSARSDALPHVLERLLIQSGFVLLHADPKIDNPHPSILTRNVGCVCPRLNHVRVRAAIWVPNCCQ